MNFPILKLGSTGQWVRYLQDLLNRNGYSVEIDGIFGPQTKQTVMYLQNDKNLKVDGIVGQETWSSIKNNIIYKGKVCSKPNIIKHIIPVGIRRPQYKLTPEWVTIHNTGNPNSNAIGERSWLVNPNNDRIASWHYCVDDKRAVQAIPDNENAWHAGDGKEGPGNRTSLSIEVCESGNQQKTWENAVGLAANLLYKHNLNIERLTTHNRWTGKNCPRLILSRWNEFVADVNTTLEYLKEINKPSKEEKLNVSLINKILDIIYRFLRRIIGGK